MLMTICREAVFSTEFHLFGLWDRSDRAMLARFDCAGQCLFYRLLCFQGIDHDNNHEFALAG